MLMLRSMMKRMKQVPVFGRFLQWADRKIAVVRFPGSTTYWERRYTGGGSSGSGSYGQLAEFKARVINDFVSTHDVRYVIEFGCGDGNQLQMMRYPRYLGLDVSEHAVQRCRQAFATDPTKTFLLLQDHRDAETCDLALSLDVIFHLVEEHVYEKHMNSLFNASDRFVIIYSSNDDDGQHRVGAHEKHRQFTAWVGANQPHWKMIEHIPNPFPYDMETKSGSRSDFFVYRKRSAES